MLHEKSQDSGQQSLTVKMEFDESLVEKQNSISCIALSHRVEQNVPARFELVIADKKCGVPSAAGDITSTGRQTPSTAWFNRFTVGLASLSL